MPEFRRDPLTDTWVIIAEERGHRPRELEPASRVEDPEYCPFEAGNEDMTPPEILSLGGNEADDSWDVRVIPNKYPALAIEGDPDRRGLGMFDRMNGIGAHEVVIETPEHDGNFDQHTPEHADRILRAYQQRIQDLRKDRRLRYVMAFKNHGAEAGATMAHPHSQIVALSLTPKRVKEQLLRARDHYREKERCLLCDLIRQEREDGSRIVLDDPEYVVLCPFASRFSFETWILPKDHNHHFTNVTDAQRRRLGELMVDVIGRMNEALTDPPYNFLFNTAPNTNDLNPQPNRWATIEHDFHWHLEILPRVSQSAGFEYGTGFHINPTPPEEAARFLREVTRNDE